MQDPLYMYISLMALICLFFRNPVMFLDFIYFNLTWKGREFLRLCKFVHGIAEDIINTRKKTIVNWFLCIEQNVVVCFMFHQQL